MSPRRSEERQAVLDELRTLAGELTQLEERLAQLYEQRRGVILWGRNMNPPLSNATMAEAAGVTEVAIIRARNRFQDKLDKRMGEL